MTLFRLNLGLLVGSVTGDALSGEVAESDGSRIPDATPNGLGGTTVLGSGHTLLNNNWMTHDSIPSYPIPQTMLHDSQSAKNSHAIFTERSARARARGKRN
jgi:hypothetical protein